MSKCAYCGFDHHGVGQSPEHPAEVSAWPILLLATFLVLSLIMLEVVR